MNFSRFRILVFLYILIGAISISATTVLAQAPQVAKNIGDARQSSFDSNDQAPKPKDITTDRTGGGVNVSRVGVQTALPISLSLIEAIRRALENNNDIEISR